MVSCDCCGREVDERSLQMVGKYFVCPGCHGGYDEDELVGKCEGRDIESRIRMENIRVFNNLREQFRLDTGREAMVNGVIDPGYTLWLEGLLNGRR